jgi:hypothetical protein
MTFLFNIKQKASRGGASPNEAFAKQLNFVSVLGKLETCHARPVDVTTLWYNYTTGFKFVKWVGKI